MTAYWWFPHLYLPDHFNPVIVCFQFRESANEIFRDEGSDLFDPMSEETVFIGEKCHIRAEGLEVPFQLFFRSPSWGWASWRKGAAFFNCIWCSKLCSFVHVRYDILLCFVSNMKHIFFRTKNYKHFTKRGFVGSPFLTVHHTRIIYFYLTIFYDPCQLILFLNNNTNNFKTNLKLSLNEYHIKSYVCLYTYFIHTHKPQLSKSTKYFYYKNILNSPVPRCLHLVPILDSVEIRILQFGQEFPDITLKR